MRLKQSMLIRLKAKLYSIRTRTMFNYPIPYNGAMPFLIQLSTNIHLIELLVCVTLTAAKSRRYIDLDSKVCFLSLLLLMHDRDGAAN